MDLRTDDSRSGKTFCWKLGRFRLNSSSAPRSLLSAGSCALHFSKRWDLLRARLRRVSTPQWLTTPILAVGIALRLNEYLINRSLWLDEAFLALNIIERSFADLLLPLSYNQGAPLGFLFMEKAMVVIFGNNELVLRCVPFLASIVSLFVLWAVARRLLPHSAVPVVLGLFALSSTLVRYSAEAKQYSSDVAVALLLIWAGLPIVQGRWKTSWRICFAVLGAALQWFSHPSVFVLAAIAFGMLVSCLRGRQWQQLLGASAICACWVGSFALHYFVSLRTLGSNQGLLNYWREGFLRFPPTTLTDLDFLASKVLSMFSKTGGLGFVGISAMASLVGCFGMFSRNREAAPILVLPGVLCLVASALEKYPFDGRMILFLMPCVFLLTAEGVEQIRSRTWRESLVVTICLLLFLFFHPSLRAIELVQHPVRHDEMRLGLDYAIRNRQSGDLFYVYQGAIPTFLYYAKRYGFAESEYVLGSLPLATEELDTIGLKTRRVWVVYARGPDRDLTSLLSYFDRAGERLHTTLQPAAFVYLYHLADPLERAALPVQCEPEIQCEVPPVSISSDYGDNRLHFETVREDGARLIAFNGRVVYHRFEAPVGQVSIQVTAHGTFGGGRYPLISVALVRADDNAELGRHSVQLVRAIRRHIVQFEISQGGAFYPVLVFLDDFAEPGQGDRNVAVYRLEIRVSPD